MLFTKQHCVLSPAPVTLQYACHGVPRVVIIGLTRWFGDRTTNMRRANPPDGAWHADALATNQGRV